MRGVRGGWPHSQGGDRGFESRTGHSIRTSFRQVGGSSTCVAATRLGLASPKCSLQLPADLEQTADGAALRVVPVHDDTLVEADGRLVIPASGVTIGDELVQVLRDADRR